MLELGDPAPDFAVGATRLHQILQRADVVLFFYPKAFTPGCTAEACGFRDEHERLRRAGAEVIGVSADSQATADRFSASLQLSYPLVGDGEGEILRAYGVRWPLIGLARRVSFVIGRDGRIRSVRRSERDALSHVASALELLGGRGE